jgi:hypothetical protein
MSRIVNDEALSESILRCAAEKIDAEKCDSTQS